MLFRRAESEDVFLLNVPRWRMDMRWSGISPEKTQRTKRWIHRREIWWCLTSRWVQRFGWAPRGALGSFGTDWSDRESVDICWLRVPVRES